MQLMNLFLGGRKGSARFGCSPWNGARQDTLKLYLGPCNAIGQSDGRPHI